MTHTMPGEPLVALDLPFAPPVTRSAASPMRAPKAPALALLALGAFLVLGPIVGGLFARVAAGKQMIDQFAPHMDTDALARYGADLTVLRRGAAGIDTVYREQAVPAGRFAGLDDYRLKSAAIVDRASNLLDRVTASQSDYREVARIGGFDRVPFLLVLSGIAAIYGGSVLLGGRRSRAQPAVVLVVIASAAVALYPFASGLLPGGRAGHRLLHSLAPVMTAAEVRQLQDDFVVIVNADGELDTSFRAVPRSGAASAEIDALVNGWPTISSDLASLVGAVNDNLGNFRSLDDLERVSRPVGVSGLEAFPWVLMGVGMMTALLSIAGMPRRMKQES
jgi:hypothetical protein